MDYSTKITRARFEDLVTIPLMALKNTILSTLSTASNNKVYTPESITLVTLAGGVTAMPKIQATMKTLFPTAQFPKVRFEYSESLCIGAALHAKHLHQLVTFIFV